MKSSQGKKKDGKRVIELKIISNPKYPCTEEGEDSEEQADVYEEETDKEEEVEEEDARPTRPVQVRGGASRSNREEWGTWSAVEMLSRQMHRVLNRQHHVAAQPGSWWQLGLGGRGAGFRNVNGSGPVSGALLAMLRARNELTMPDEATLRAAYPVRTPPWSQLHRCGRRGELSVLWVGHATMVVRVDGLTILTDPVFSSFLSPMPWSNLGIPRFTGLPLQLDELPVIDVVLLSHSHYDHCDLPSLRALAQQAFPPQLWVAPLGLGAWLREHVPKAAEAVVELDWWQSVELGRAGEDYHISALPCQHWSNRGLRDRNQTLWAAFAVVTPRVRVAFVGDSAYCPHFAEWGQCYGGFDLALLPIGAYQPRESHQHVHMSPEDAVMAAEDMNARHVLGHHFGTFGGKSFGYRPILEPPLDFAKAVANKGWDPSLFRTLQHGEWWSIYKGSGLFDEL